jgi:hypothetical protein
LSTAKAWQARKDVVLPLQAHCLCCLIKQRDANGHPTLGFFRPAKIDRLTITEEDPNWTAAQAATLKQQHLWVEAPERELEKIPFSFRYEFRCDEADCKGHKIICTDWEMGESYRKWKAKYGDGWEEKFRQRYEREMIEKNDTHFYVGTIHQHPHVWIIVGLFYPPRIAEDQQIGLF